MSSTSGEGGVSWEEKNMTKKRKILSIVDQNNATDDQSNSFELTNARNSWCSSHNNSWFWWSLRIFFCFAIYLIRYERWSSPKGGTCTARPTAPSAHCSFSASTFRPFTNTTECSRQAVKLLMVVRNCGGYKIAALYWQYSVCKFFDNYAEKWSGFLWCDCYTMTELQNSVTVSRRKSKNGECYGGWRELAVHIWEQLVE